MRRAQIAMLMATLFLGSASQAQADEVITQDTKQQVADIPLDPEKTAAEISAD